MKPRLVVFLALSIAQAAAQTGWTLVWSDEFDGTALDASKWTYDKGGNGWGNNELEYYTDRAENVRIENGMLVIQARKEAHGGRAYTSGRIKTLGRFAQAYGRFEARIKIPQGQGIWPAFWMLGNDVDTAGIGWPKCGEIDIMENIGKEPNVVHGTIHGPGYSGGGGIGQPYTLPQPAAADFHLFAVEWEPEEIRWYVDDVNYFKAGPSRIPAGARWVYDHPFFLLLNVAVGGNWPGNPDASTALPQSMLVDYVRVYKRAGR